MTWHLNHPINFHLRIKNLLYIKKSRNAVEKEKVHWGDFQMIFSYPQMPVSAPPTTLRRRWFSLFPAREKKNNQSKASKTMKRRSWSNIWEPFIKQRFCVMWRNKYLSAGGVGGRKKSIRSSSFDNYPRLRNSFKLQSEQATLTTTTPTTTMMMWMTTKGKGEDSARVDFTSRVSLQLIDSWEFAFVHVLKRLQAYNDWWLSRDLFTWTV